MSILAGLFVLYDSVGKSGITSYTNYYCIIVVITESIRFENLAAPSVQR